MRTAKNQLSRPLPGSYRLYNLALRSHLPLPCPEAPPSVRPSVELFDAPTSHFLEGRHACKVAPTGGHWCNSIRLSDGSYYLRWDGLFEFLVSADGRRVACRSYNRTSLEAFQTYLVGQVLSFAMVKQGIEPLHATVVVVNEQAVAFLGDSGYGKSTLGAAFLNAGHAMLTDDILVISRERSRLVAHPGPPRIKLFPDIAERFFGSQVDGVPMNPETTKLVVSLSADLSAQQPKSLRAVYVLNPPSGIRNGRITLRKLPAHEACLALIANTFNTVVTDPSRLAIQFDWAVQLVSDVPVKSLLYPRRLTVLSTIVKAIQADLN